MAPASAGDSMNDNGIPQRFRNRAEAGRLLAFHLARYAHRSRFASRRSACCVRDCTRSELTFGRFARAKVGCARAGRTAVPGGGRVSSFLTLMSGLPLYFSASSSSLLAPGNTQTPDLVAPVKILHGIGLGDPWFSTSSFAAPAANTFGNVGRNFLEWAELFQPGCFAVQVHPIHGTLQSGAALRGIWRDQYAAVLLRQRQWHCGRRNAR